MKNDYTVKKQNTVNKGFNVGILKNPFVCIAHCSGRSR